MLPAPDLHEVARTLQERPASLIGLLFAPPYTKIAAEKIVPRISYFNERMGQAVHFFCAGYGGYGFAEDSQAIGEFHYNDGSVIPWGFSQQKFAKFVNELQKATSWRYSGESDLILVEPRFNFAGKEPQLDFSDVLVFDLEAMVRDGAIDHVPRLFERITDYAQTQGFNATTSDFSNRRGVHIGAEALASAIVGLTPKAVQILLKQGVHYRTRNIAR